MTHKTRDGPNGLTSDRKPPGASLVGDSIHSCSGAADEPDSASSGVCSNSPLLLAAHPSRPAPSVIASAAEIVKVLLLLVAAAMLSWMGCIEMDGVTEGQPTLQPVT